MDEHTIPQIKDGVCMIFCMLLSYIVYSVHEFFPIILILILTVMIYGVLELWKLIIYNLCNK